MTSNCCGFFHFGIWVTYGLPCDPTGIDNEWRKTQCMPREVCIDVGKEFGAATNTFFKPPCVSVYRCGGCCNSEGQQCMNTSTSYLSKTVGARLRQGAPRPGFTSAPFQGALVQGLPRSPVVATLRLPILGAWVLSLAEDLRPYMPCSQRTKTLKKKRSNIVTNSIKTLKMVHIKRKRFLK